MLTAQASGAQIQPFWLTLNGDSNGVNIRHPVALGMTFRVAYVVTELG